MSDNRQITIFPTFEDFRHENDNIYWFASDLLRLLGYDNMESFKEPIEKAKKVLEGLKIPLEGNFTSIPHHNGTEDYKLSRFACYITVMNSDSEKEQVARAQVYFVQQVRKFELIAQNREDFERLGLRYEFSESHKKLSYTAKEYGIENYAKFHNAGYLGLYNMYNFELAKKRDIDKDSLINYMGNTELAANIFRVTLTETKIKNENIKGQKNLEDTHKEVGQGVRDLVYKITNTYPEDLPVEKEIPKIEKDLKSTHKKMLKQDKKRKGK